MSPRHIAEIAETSSGVLAVCIAKAYVWAFEPSDALANVGPLVAWIPLPAMR